MAEPTLQTQYDKAVGDSELAKKDRIAAEAELEAAKEKFRVAEAELEAAKAKFNHAETKFKIADSAEFAAEIKVGELLEAIDKQIKNEKFWEKN